MAIDLIVEIRGDDLAPLPRQANGGAPEHQEKHFHSRLPLG